MNAKLLHGDCLEKLKELKADSVDCIVTDPPYGMSFMGKKWDKALPPVAVWKECLRVLKPSAFAFVMCIPRSDCSWRMMSRLEEAGFVISFSPIIHAFATGFPKAQNLSKLADKRAGVEREVIGTKADFAIDGHNRNPNRHQKGTELSMSNESGESWSQPVTLPTSPAAKKLDGAFAGAQYKPAFELVITAMKPIEKKTYLDQALSNGHGCTWLGDCRVPFESEDDKGDPKRFQKTDGGVFLVSDPSNTEVGVSQGRFPANLVVSDDVLNDGCSRPSGGGRKGESGKRQYDDTMGSRTGDYGYTVDELGKDGEDPERGGYKFSQAYADSGSFSRYFSLDAWAAKLPEHVRRVSPFLLVPKPSKSEKNKGLSHLPKKFLATMRDGIGNREHNSKQATAHIQNNHPTCKPVLLMTYLITLASRKGDTVLDPYCGSGTTGVAAVALERHFIGIELDEGHAAIAQARIEHAEKTLQKTMF